MEVFCPKCPEGYRIPIDRIPTKPRMVMCHSCGATWMQQFPEQTSLSSRISENTQSVIRSIKRPIYPKAVLAILHEEAALEAKRRN